jgi:hypothetical protein
MGAQVSKTEGFTNADVVQFCIIGACALVVTLVESKWFLLGGVVATGSFFAFSAWKASIEWPQVLEEGPTSTVVRLGIMTAAGFLFFYALWFTGRAFTA